MILANLLLYGNFRIWQKTGTDGEGNALEAYIQASVIWMLYTYSSSELLSLFHGLTVKTVWAVWAVLDLVLLSSLLIGCRQRGIKSLKKKNMDWKKLWKYREVWVLIGIGIIVLILALWTVPYNWDSMTYRLARVAYWAQNGSVEHYASNNLRQIANPPLGEFVLLHIYLFWKKSEALFNLLQCISYFTCTVMVYAITKKLRCRRSFCFIAALLFMSMPIAFGEAINTQVDLFSTVWLLYFVYLLMDLAETPVLLTFSKENIKRVCIMGLTVSWGYLAKPSVCIAMAVFGVWLLICCVVRRDKFFVLLRLAGCAAGSMLITLPWEIGRNIRSFHAVSAQVAGARQLVGTIHPLYLLVNFTKNFVHNLPNVYLQQATDLIQSFLWKLSNLLHVDLNAETISEDGRSYMVYYPPDYGHDTAINPIVVWLLILCIVWAIFTIRHIKWKEVYKSYSVTAAAAFLIFCVVLRWEPYVTRYMLSFQALLCPMIASQLQKQTEGRKKYGLRYAVLGIISCLCLLDVANMIIYHRNICVRQEANKKPQGYFVNRSNEYEAYVLICDYIRKMGYREIGVCLGADDYEYPFWTILQEDISRIEHVNVQNESAIYVDTDYTPQCIIWFGNLPQESFCWNGTTYGNVVEIAEGRYVLTIEE